MRPIAVARSDAPEWAMVLLPPPVSEAPPPDLPPPPPEIDLPPAPETKIVMPQTPVDVSPLAQAPDQGPAPDLTAQGERPTPRSPGPVTFGPRYPAVDRLRATNRDPRLFSPLPKDIVALSDAQKAQLDLSMTILAVTDSLYSLELAGQRMTDWTYKDKNGKSWGVQKGRVGSYVGPVLVLGDLVIPLPYQFSPPLGPNAIRTAWMNNDVLAQADRQSARQTLKDRAAEIRRRRDAERAAARQKADSVTSNPPANREDPPRTVR